MQNPDHTRRKLLTGIAVTSVGSISATVSLGASTEDGFIFEPPSTTSMAIAGSDERFPVRRVFCLGRNYRAHAFESGDDPDVNPPFFFIKPRDAVVDSREPFPYPLVTQALRYEGEMVVALHSGGTNIEQADALNHVFGYGIGLDMTREDLQHIAQDLSRPWAISKSFDRSAPCGPLYPVSEHGHRLDGRIWLSVNGQIKQDSDLALMRWSVQEAINILSSHYELKAGDIIMTGTPEGVDLVEPGDIIRCGVEGLGEIEVSIT